MALLLHRAPLYFTSFHTARKRINLAAHAFTVTEVFERPLCELHTGDLHHQLLSFHKLSSSMLLGLYCWTSTEERRSNLLKPQNTAVQNVLKNNVFELVGFRFDLVLLCSYSQYTFILSWHAREKRIKLNMSITLVFNRKGHEVNNSCHLRELLFIPGLLKPPIFLFKQPRAVWM